MVGNESWSSQDTDDILTLALVSGPGQPRSLGVDEGAPSTVSPDGRRFMLNASCVFDLRLEPNAMPYALGIDGPVWAAEWRAG